MSQNTVNIKRRIKLRIPDEYICDTCGYVFLSCETKNIFCPECGSSMVIKEISFEEFLDEDAFVNIKMGIMGR